MRVTQILESDRARDRGDPQLHSALGAGALLTVRVVPTPDGRGPFEAAPRARFAPATGVPTSHVGVCTFENPSAPKTMERISYGQVPPVGMERGAVSLAHLRSQALPLMQVTPHEPVQTTWQVAPVHPMLLLDPTVKLQVAPVVQPRLALAPAVTEQELPLLHVPLHDDPQLPPQVPVVHDKEQLAAAGSQPMVVNESPPHAASTAAPTTAIRYLMRPSCGCFQVRHRARRPRARMHADLSLDENSDGSDR